MKKLVKYILIGAVVVAVAAGIIYNAMLPITLETVAIAPKTAEVYFIEQGVATAERTVDVYSVVAGQLQPLNIAENDSITKGDVICVVDSSYLELELLQLQSQLKALKAQNSTTVLSKEEQLRLQNIVIEQCKSDVEKATEAFENAKVLFNSDMLTKSEYENAQKLVEITQNALAQSTQQIKLIEASQTGNSNAYYQALIEGNEVSVQQLNKKIEDCVVKSPVSGVVTKLNIKDTNTVGVQTPVATITSGAKNSVDVYVSTNEIDDIHLNDTVDLILKRRNGDKTYGGIVTGIDKEAVVKMSLLGVEERRVKVTVTPLAGVEEIKTGYNVDVKFITYRENDRLLVPNTALFKVDDNDTVWVVEDGVAKMRSVTKGMELRTETVIEAGLSAGDVVIIKADDSALKTGVRVK